MAENSWNYPKKESSILPVNFLKWKFLAFLQKKIFQKRKFLTVGNFLKKEILVVEKCPKKEIQTMGIFLKKEIFWHFGHPNLSQKGNIAIKTHPKKGNFPIKTHPKKEILTIKTFPKKEIFWHFWQSNLFLKRKFTSAYVINLHQRSRLYKESNIKPPHPRNLTVNPWLSPEGACHRFTVMFLTHPCWELSVMLCHPCKGFYTSHIDHSWMKT